MTVSAALASLAPDDWLSGRLGKPAWRLVGTPSSPGELTGLLGDVGAASFVDAKVPTDDVRTAVLLQDAGFRVVDTAVTLERRGRAGRARADVEAAVAADADSVAELARRSLVWSRFHLDPLLGHDIGAEIKAAWTRSWFAGTRGDSMLVVRDGGEVVGFLLLLDRPDHLVIDLVAVAPGRQGSGVGRALVEHADATCGGAPAMLVGTQAANVGALAFYESLGFRIVRTEHVLHRHGS